jgi:hypothetical protein
MLYRALDRLGREGVSAPDALLVLRCARGTTFDLPPCWNRERLLDYSSMEVHLLRVERH